MRTSSNGLLKCMLHVFKHSQCGPNGRSMWSWQTVCVVLTDGSSASMVSSNSHLTSRFYHWNSNTNGPWWDHERYVKVVFWTVLNSTARFEERGYKYPMLGMGEPLLALWKVCLLLLSSPSPLSHSLFWGCIFLRLRASFFNRGLTPFPLKTNENTGVWW
jgi:hypothetical protein